MALMDTAESGLRWPLGLLTYLKGHHYLSTTTSNVKVFLCT